MLEIAKKALWMIRSRPTLFVATLRQYVLFVRTHALQFLVFTPSQGIHLGENVRVQRLSCLSAERPGATIRVDRDCVIYENAKIQAFGKGRIEIGDSSIIGDARIQSRCAIRIGSRVVTSWNVFISDFDAHPIQPELRGLQMLSMTRGFRPTFGAVASAPALNWEFPTSEVQIGDDVWIGANVTILKGARIGAGCVIATGAVVTAGDWPTRSILAGVPARVVKRMLPLEEMADTAKKLSESIEEAVSGLSPGLTTAAAIACAAPYSMEAAKALAGAAARAVEDEPELRR